MALCWAADVAAAFPATGQISCWDSSGTEVLCVGTGQDGEIQAGATLRFIDNGNGTIKDMNTTLVWEKQSRDGTVHDQDNLYTWDEAFEVHIAALNTPPCFAGNCDWRLPNVRELQSIVNYEKVNPAVSRAFNKKCVAGATVLTGSCTVNNYYWTSTSYIAAPGFAWILNFIDGGILWTYKTWTFPVRAVRGGTP